ncbi:hypothetical protein [Bradyrhizobium sediminis]|nr:hypothetical protein [Bradyrhizobium sediminis]
MSDVIPFPKPSKPKDDETAELLKLLERIANSSKSKDKNNKEQER